MDIFVKYIDKIKAEEDLKEKTKAFVVASLQDEVQPKKHVKTGMFLARGDWAMKKLWVTALSLAFCAVLAFGGYSYCNTPVNYVSLDINPSVELGINAFGNVVRVEGCNDDGELLLRERKLTHQSLAEAINALIQEASAQGFILDDGSTVIALTIETEDEEEAADLQDESRQGFDKALRAKNINAILYLDCASLELRTEAKEMGISPGKYKLIEVLQALDPDITAEEYKNAKVTEIMTKANELLSDLAEGKNPEEFKEALEKIIPCAKQIQKAKEKQAINGNQEQKQNHDFDFEQEQEQEQEQNKNQDKNQNNANGLAISTQEQSQKQNQESSPALQNQEQNKVKTNNAESGKDNLEQKKNNNGQGTSVNLTNKNTNNNSNDNSNSNTANITNDNAKENGNKK